ncbi:cenp-O kinetochore centromere component [Xylariaceae sp. FL1272]|nr:cenp-O kinetochore centromere component [Xylariaceae sp. FL1272]
MASRESLSPELSVADRLDDEIAKLKAQVESLRSDIKLQCSTLMRAESTRQILQNQAANGQTAATKATAKKLLGRVDKYTADKQQRLYQACASVTTFKIQDPDPNAVDNGKVLGMRFEVAYKGRYLRPYYVMLNRPWGHKRWLRVHRHTVPQCIPLSALAARHLPAPKEKDEFGRQKKQDLAQFAGAVRREIVRYHNREAVISDLKKAAGPGTQKKAQEESELGLVDVRAADAEAKQISLQWRDGRSGRLVMDDDGEVVKMVVQGHNGQDRETVRQFLGGSVRVEEVTKRLGDG